MGTFYPQNAIFQTSNSQGGLKFYRFDLKIWRGIFVHLKAPEKIGVHLINSPNDGNRIIYIQGGPYVTANLYWICLSEHEESI